MITHDVHPSIRGRRVAITGGSRGLGRAMAIAFAQAGACVGIVARTGGAPLSRTLELLAHPLQPPVVCLGDLRDADDCRRMRRELNDGLGGAVEVLINNAGVPNVGAGKPFWQVSADEWTNISHTNTDSIFFLTREVAPDMVAAGFGRIVNISTGSATMVRKNFAPYGPSKAFVEAASRIFAEDLKGTGVTANVLLPGGPVDTVADVTGLPTPNRSFVSAEVMSAPALWLASDLSRDHSGERFVANLWDESLPLTERIAKARQCGAEAPTIM